MRSSCRHSLPVLAVGPSTWLFRRWLRGAGKAAEREQRVCAGTPPGQRHKPQAFASAKATEASSSGLSPLRRGERRQARAASVRQARRGEKTASGPHSPPALNPCRAPAGRRPSAAPHAQRLGARRAGRGRWGRLGCRRGPHWGRREAGLRRDGPRRRPIGPAGSGRPAGRGRGRSSGRQRGPRLGSLGRGRCRPGTAGAQLAAAGCPSAEGGKGASHSGRSSEASRRPRRRFAPGLLHSPACPAPAPGTGVREGRGEKRGGREGRPPLAAAGSEVGIHCSEISPCARPFRRGAGDEAARGPEWRLAPGCASGAASLSGGVPTPVSSSSGCRCSLPSFGRGRPAARPARPRL